MKKLVIALILAALVATGVWYAWQRGLVGGPGGAPQVEVTVKDADGLGGLRVELEFDPAAGRVESVEPGKLARNALLETNLATPGRVVIALVDMEGIKGDGPVAVLRFAPTPGNGAPSELRVRSVEAYHAETRYELAPKPSPGRVPGGRAPTQAVTLDFGRD